MADVGNVANRRGMRQWRNVYDSALRDLTTILFSLPVGKYSEIGAIRIQARANKLIDKLNRTVVRLADSTVTDSFDYSVAVTKTQLEMIGAKPSEMFNVDAANAEATRRNADELTMTMLRANASMRRTVDQYSNLLKLAKMDTLQIHEFQAGWVPGAIEWLEDVVDYAIKNQLARASVTAQIQNYLRTIVLTGKFIQINGRNYRINKYAEMVSRTVFRAAQTDATVNMCEKYDNDLVRVSKHHPECESHVCQKYEGKVFSLFGKTKGFQLLEKRPPFHPNCMHNIRPTSIEAIRAREIFGQRPGVVT